MRRKLCEVNGLAGPAPAPPFTPGRGERASCPCSLSLLPGVVRGKGKKGGHSSFGYGRDLVILPAPRRWGSAWVRRCRREKESGHGRT